MKLHNYRTGSIFLRPEFITWLIKCRVPKAKYDKAPMVFLHCRILCPCVLLLIGIVLPILIVPIMPNKSVLKKIYFHYSWSSNSAVSAVQSYFCGVEMFGENIQTVWIQIVWIHNIFGENIQIEIVWILKQCGFR